MQNLWLDAIGRNAKRGIWHHKSVPNEKFIRIGGGDTLFENAVTSAQDFDEVLAKLKSGINPTTPYLQSVQEAKFGESGGTVPVLHRGVPIGVVDSFDGVTASVKLWGRYAGIETDEDGRLTAIEIAP